MAEARVLVNELIEHATQPQFAHRHTWQTGDLLMWDNRSHYIAVGASTTPSAMICGGRRLWKIRQSREQATQSHRRVVVVDGRCSDIVRGFLPAGSDDRSGAVFPGERTATDAPYNDLCGTLVIVIPWRRFTINGRLFRPVSPRRRSFLLSRRSFCCAPQQISAGDCDARQLFGPCRRTNEIAGSSSALDRRGTAGRRVAAGADPQVGAR